MNSVSGLALDFGYGLALDFCFCLYHMQLVNWQRQFALLYIMSNLLLLYGVHPTFYFCTVCTVSATCSIIFYNVTFSVYSFICFFQKVTLSTIWFVVYDGMPCWNMIGKNEDWLLYTNTGQAFNIDTISLETSQYFTSTDFLCFFYWSASCKKPCQSPCIPPIIGVADMDLLCVERTLKWLCQTFEGSTHPRLR